MKCSSLVVAVVAVGWFFSAGPVASSAVITTIFTEDFSDATLAPGLIANATPTIAGGYVDLNGANGNNTAQGFYLDGINVASGNIPALTGADGGAGPQGGGPLVSFIMEAVIGPDGVAGSDGLGAAPSSNDVIFSFNGRYGLRFATATNWSLFARAAGGASDVNTGIPNSADYPTAGSHVAIVFTDNGAADTLQYYKDGVLALSISGDFNRFNIARASWGLEVNTGAPLSRGFNGTFDAISLATFTGTFDPAAGDKFVLLVPEPAAGILGLAACAAARWCRRRGAA